MMRYVSHVDPVLKSFITLHRGKCSVNYLRRNVRTLNKPVCYIPSAEEGEHWWPSRVPPLDKPTPAKTNDSTMRADFLWGDRKSVV